MAWDKFLVNLHNILDRHAPLKKITITEDLPRWMTREYLELCNDRDYWIKKQTQSDDPIAQIMTKDYKVRVRRLKRSLKQNYFKDDLQEAKGDSAQVWKAINEAFNSVSRKKIKNHIEWCRRPQIKCRYTE